MERIALFLFLILYSNISLSFGCIPPSGNVKDIESWYASISSLVFKAKLADLKYRETTNKREGWKVFTVTYTFKSIEIIKGDYGNTEITLDREIACKDCDINGYLSTNSHRVGDSYNLYINYNNGDIEFNSCARMGMVKIMINGVR